jgi:hypothetical protein
VHTEPTALSGRHASLTVDVSQDVAEGGEAARRNLRQEAAYNIARGLAQEAAAIAEAAEKEHAAAAAVAAVQAARAAEEQMEYDTEMAALNATADGLRAQVESFRAAQAERERLRSEEVRSH